MKDLSECLPEGKMLALLLHDVILDGLTGRAAPGKDVPRVGSVGINNTWSTATSLGFRWSSSIDGIDYSLRDSLCHRARSVCEPDIEMW